MAITVLWRSTQLISLSAFYHARHLKKVAIAQRRNCAMHSKHHVMMKHRHHLQLLLLLERIPSTIERNHFGFARFIGYFNGIGWLLLVIRPYKIFECFRNLWVCSARIIWKSRKFSSLWFPDNVNHRWSVFLWNGQSRPNWHTIGSRGIVYSDSGKSSVFPAFSNPFEEIAVEFLFLISVGKFLHTHVFGDYSVSKTRSIVYARTSSWTLWYVPVLFDNRFGFSKINAHINMYNFLNRLISLSFRFPVWFLSPSFSRQFSTFWLG